MLSQQQLLEIAHFSREEVKQYMSEKRAIMEHIHPIVNEQYITEYSDEEADLVSDMIERLSMNNEVKPEPIEPETPPIVPFNEGTSRGPRGYNETTAPPEVFDVPSPSSYGEPNVFYPEGYDYPYDDNIRDDRYWGAPEDHFWGNAYIDTEPRDYPGNFARERYGPEYGFDETSFNQRHMEERPDMYLSGNDPYYQDYGRWNPPGLDMYHPDNLPPEFGGYRPNYRENEGIPTIPTQNIGPEGPMFGIPTIPVMPMRGTRGSRGRPRTTAHRGRRIPSEYVVRHNPWAEQNKVLDLDCVRRKENEIDGWSKQMKIIIQTTESLRSNNEAARAFLQYHMRGNAQRWFLTSPYTQEQRRNPLTGALEPNPDYKLGGATTMTEYIDTLTKLLYNEFTGKNELQHPDLQSNELSDKAAGMLEGTFLCDMCDFRNFVCYYEKWFYHLKPEKRAAYEEMFFRKLPPTWRERATNAWAIRPATITAGLAGRIRIVEKMIEEECKTARQRLEFSNLKDKACCDPALYDIPIQWGCGRPRQYNKRRTAPRRKSYAYATPRRRKRYRRKTSPKRYKKRRSYNKPAITPGRRQFIPRTRKFKRNYKKKQPQAYCPTGKKTCKCWICQEEGHYANECPNKDKSKNKEKVKILEIVNKMDLAPIEDEDEISDNESIYSIDSDYTIKSFDTDPGSEWELVDD